MANNPKNIKKSVKSEVENSEENKISLYSKAPYFKKKDKQAIEFLTKHPIPEELLNKLLKK